MRHNPKPNDITGDTRRAAIARAEAAFNADYVRYQYTFVDFLADHLADVSRVFNGDLHMAVLLAVIGQVHLNAAMAADLSGKKIDELPLDRRGISTNRLSDVTGVPRETVRRKLLKMQSMGWLQRDDNAWSLAFDGDHAVARGELADLDSRAIKRTARFSVLLREIIDGN